MPTADTSNNIIITTYDATAILGTDYGTSGTGLSLAHIPIQKLAWGSESQAYRVTESTPLPVSILGVTGGSNVLGVTFGAITGSVSVNNRAGTYLVVGGPSGSIVDIKAFQLLETFRELQTVFYSESLVLSMFQIQLLFKD